jgi:hypothetical protein
METTRGISLCSYLYLKLAKTPCSYYDILCFLFYKIGEKVGKNRFGERMSSTRESGGRERSRSMNMVQIMYIHVCKYKNDTC